MYYRAKIAGHIVYFSFSNEKTAELFGNELIADSHFDGVVVTVPEQIISQYMLICNETWYPYAEHMCALYMASNYLLRYDCCAFHSVAICVNGKGYLISASSGVGKSTQYMNLRELYQDQIQIINGDKPFLEFRKDGKIMIHPSLWRGKEDFGSDKVCELSGLIFLAQSDHNEIKRILPENGVAVSLTKFLYYPESEELVRKVCDLDQRLLQNTPIWYLKNTGDLNSSRLLYEAVLSDGGDL